MTVSTTCACATTIKYHTDDVSAKIQVPWTKKYFLRKKYILELVRAILLFYLNGFRRYLINMALVYVLGTEHNLPLNKIAIHFINLLYLLLLSYRKNYKKAWSLGNALSKNAFKTIFWERKNLSCSSTLRTIQIHFFITFSLQINNLKTKQRQL